MLNHTTKKAYFWICLQSFLRKLAIKTAWKNIIAPNITKNSALIFLPYFKNKYFLPTAPHDGHLISSQKSVELTADKMQNLLTKQEPEGAGNTDLHELQKKLSLQPHFPNKNIFWDIRIYQIKCSWGPGIYYRSIFFPFPFSSHCLCIPFNFMRAFNIDKQNKSCRFSTQ